MAPSLVVMNARAATLGDGKLTLTGVLPNTILLLIGPRLVAGHAPTARLLEEWSANHSFAKDPPNATVSVLSKDSSGVADAVVVLERPKSRADTLTFDVRVLEGSLGMAPTVRCRCSSTPSPFLCSRSWPTAASEARPTTRPGTGRTATMRSRRPRPARARFHEQRNGHDALAAMKGEDRFFQQLMRSAVP